jgi:hypothetical protein
MAWPACLCAPGLIKLPVSNVAKQRCIEAAAVTGLTTTDQLLCCSHRRPRFPHAAIPTRVRTIAIGSRAAPHTGPRQLCNSSPLTGPQEFPLHHTAKHKRTPCEQVTGKWHACQQRQLAQGAPCCLSTNFVTLQEYFQYYTLTINRPTHTHVEWIRTQQINLSTCSSLSTQESALPRTAGRESLPHSRPKPRPVSEPTACRVRSWGAGLPPRPPSSLPYMLPNNSIWHLM